MAPMTPGTLVEAVALGVDSTAFLCFPLIMENQMEKKMENEMETAILYLLYIYPIII